MKDVESVVGVWGVSRSQGRRHVIVALLPSPLSCTRPAICFAWLLVLRLRTV